MHLKTISPPVVDIATDDRPFLDIIMEEVNDFLKTPMGLQYLIMRYPDLSVEQAIKEYSSAIYQANNYDVQDMW